MIAQIVPIITVVMPVYNSAMTLAQSVQSVRAQTSAHWELLMIDDGSTDNSVDIAERLVAADPRIRLLRQPKNAGAAAARNAGIGEARGRYIAFLDSDDEWTPEKLERQIAFMQQTGAVLSYTEFWRVTGDIRHHVKVPPTVTRQELLRGNVIGCLTVIYDTQHFGIAKMPILKMRHDFAFWLELLERADRAHGLTEPLALHHNRSDSLSSPRGKAMAASWKLYREHLGLSAPRSAWYLANHVVRRIRRG